MVYGASWCALKDYAAFAKLGFMGTPCRSCFLALSHELDSKQLKLARREELFKDIRECRKVQVCARSWRDCASHSQCDDRTHDPKPSFLVPCRLTSK